MRRGLPEPVTTLAERLRAEGFRTGAVVSHHLLKASYRFDQGFDSFAETRIGDDATEGRGHCRM